MTYRHNDPYDQYTQYPKLPLLLRRFSFAAKMKAAHESSVSVANFFRKPLKTSERPLPWVIETFVMLAMEAKEYDNKDFSGNDINKFIKMQNSIWATTGEIAKASCGRFSTTEFLMPLFGSTQFSMQESNRIKMYRYSRIFSDNTEPVKLSQRFEQKFGTSYNEFLVLGYIIEVLIEATYLASRVNSIPRDVMEYLLFDRFEPAARKLTISREEYIGLQRKYAGNSFDPKDYIYSLRPSYQYAFVEYEGAIYFPLPHLFVQNITSSLLYRLTENDDDLRRNIGKQILEKYVYELLDEAAAYDEVFREQRYKKNGSEAYSPDVLARRGKNVLFVDSKSTVPGTGIRILNEAALESNITIVARNVEQLYKQMRDFKEYNPFAGEASEDPDDHWGLVLVLEDSYIPRRLYYETAATNLGIVKDSPEWYWMISHIKVVSLYQAERLCLSGYSIIDACKEMLSDPFTYVLDKIPEAGKKENAAFTSFRDKLREQAKSEFRVMIQHGYIKK